jgi:LytS/YehU family sensor histidine kinase
VACTAPAIWAEFRVSHDKLDSLARSAIASGIGAAFILIAWSALYFGFKHYQMLEEQKELLVASEATARTAQLQALQYQLQPHFLFNTLNAISSLVVSDQRALATEMLSRLGTLLRSTLQSPELYSVPLGEELAVIDEYLEIEQVRFGERLRIHFDIHEETRIAEVPRFLLQPLVENAIRHGIARRPQGGEIDIRAFLQENRLRIEVENDTGGLDGAKGETGHGLGLHNSRARLERLYGNNATLTTSLLGQRFLTSLSFPFTKASPSANEARP